MMPKNGIGLPTRSPREEQEAVTTSEFPACTMDEAHGLDLDDFIPYVGTQVLPSWQRRRATAPIMLTGILRNVRANGGTVFEVGMDEERGEAIV